MVAFCSGYAKSARIHACGPDWQSAPFDSAGGGVEAAVILEGFAKESSQILRCWVAKADLDEKPSYSVNFAYFSMLIA